MTEYEVIIEGELNIEMTPAELIETLELALCEQFFDLEDDVK